MKVLVTGAKGFIGRNLCLWLKNAGHEVFEYDLDSSLDSLKEWVRVSDFIVHLAGINRPLTPEEFIDGNVNFTVKLLSLIEESGRRVPLIFSSSTQAEKDNDYGRSKKAAEDQIFEYSEKTGNPAYVYRLYNVFGKWCRPNYNSVIATWCFNVAHNLPIQINPEAPAIDFVYIDDICKEFLRIINEQPKASLEILHVEPHSKKTLQEVADLLRSFKESRKDLSTPLQEGFEKKLYATYLSYLEEDDFAYALNPHIDNRGSFTEILKTQQFGQVSVNIGHPGITKGNHYHMTKNEKYLVLSGTCIIKFRKVGTDKVITYECSGADLKVVDIPPGYTHSITTVGDTDSVTLMWASELFDPNNPDTIYENVEEQSSKNN